MLTAADYHPPRWLRNPHLQSMLSSSRMRMQRGLVLLAATGAHTDELILDGGEGVRLQGWHSYIQGRQPIGMALLLHGWEGSAESSYMRMTAARLLEEGLDIDALTRRFGRRNTKELGGKLQEMSQTGSLIREGTNYRLPPSRVLTSNQVFAGVL